MKKIISYNYGTTQDLEIAIANHVRAGRQEALRDIVVFCHQPEHAMSIFCCVVNNLTLALTCNSEYIRTWAEWIYRQEQKDKE